MSLGLKLNQLYVNKYIGHALQCRNQGLHYRLTILGILESESPHREPFDRGFYFCIFLLTEDEFQRLRSRIRGCCASKASDCFCSEYLCKMLI
jgi:hypothetical protein